MGYETFTNKMAKYGADKWEGGISEQHLKKWFQEKHRKKQEEEREEKKKGNGGNK